MKKYIYNHPAIPRNGIVIGNKYSFEDLQKLYTTEEIKHFFKVEETEIAKEGKITKQIK